VDVVIVVEVDEAALIKRVENRASEARKKGEPVRADDDPETFKKRLAVYRAETAPVLPYYDAQGKTKRVDGMKSIDEVTAQIEAIIKAAKPRKGWFG
jgi:adenylate kinase